MTPNDFIQVQVLSLNFPKKEFCVVDYLDGGTVLYFYLNGESFFEVGEDYMMTTEEIQSSCERILELVKLSGGHKKVRPGFENFMKLMSQEFGW